MKSLIFLFRQDANGGGSIGGGFSGDVYGEMEVPEVPEIIADVHSAPDIPPIDIEGIHFNYKSLHTRFCAKQNKRCNNF